MKFYVELLSAAAFSGPDKGKIAATFGELALKLKMHKQTLYKAARELRPYYIDWESAKNQHGVTVFTIQKYKSVEDFAASRRTSSEVTAHIQRGDGEVTALSAAPTKQKGLEVPNKLKKLDKPEKQHAAWDAIGISPCGPGVFQNLWLKNFAAQNGGGLAKAMGTCLDDWAVIRGRQPNPRDFCEALARIREQSKVAPRQVAEMRELEIPEWA